MARRYSTVFWGPLWFALPVRVYSHAFSLEPVCRPVCASQRRRAGALHYEPFSLAVLYAVWLVPLGAVLLLLLLDFLVCRYLLVKTVGRKISHSVMTIWDYRIREVRAEPRGFFFFYTPQSGDSSQSIIQGQYVCVAPHLSPHACKQDSGISNSYPFL